MYSDVSIGEQRAASSYVDILCRSARPQSFPALTNYPHFPAQCSVSPSPSPHRAVTIASVCYDAMLYDVCCSHHLQKFVHAAKYLDTPLRSQFFVSLVNTIAVLQIF